MRKLIDIIEDVKDGGKPDYEELRYSVIALDALLFFDHKNLLEITKDTKEIFLKLRQEESFRRFKMALDKPPKDFVGWNNDPDNPGYQKRRKLHFKVFNEVMAKIEKDEVK
jgi:hypothetical protein